MCAVFGVTPIVTIDNSESPADMADFVEFAHGDAVSSEWGRKRANFGHPEPYNISWVEIGKCVLKSVLLLHCARVTAQRCLSGLHFSSPCGFPTHTSHLLTSADVGTASKASLPRWRNSSLPLRMRWTSERMHYGCPSTSHLCLDLGLTCLPKGGGAATGVTQASLLCLMLFLLSAIGHIGICTSNRKHQRCLRTPRGWRSCRRTCAHGALLPGLWYWRR